MKTILASIALLAACTGTPGPTPNRVCKFASIVSKDAECHPVVSGGAVDTAYVKTEGGTFFCKAPQFEAPGCQVMTTKDQVKAPPVAPAPSTPPTAEAPPK